LGLGHRVVGIDCLSDYYSPKLKERNLRNVRRHNNFKFLKLDVTRGSLSRIIRSADYVFHLAAQPGVRGSWGTNFEEYVRNNILATQSILEALKGTKVRKMIYASSSSIYGDTTVLPTLEEANPAAVSPYGITKLAGENLCSTYHKGYGLPVVILRYFTVYGPRQRPDMAFFRFIDNALSGSSVVVYGDGTASRDFTYVADTVEATTLAMEKAEPGQVFNIGSGEPVTVNETIKIMEQLLGREIHVRYEETQLGDVRSTNADGTKARTHLGFSAKKTLREGLKEQVLWQRSVRTQLATQGHL